VSATHEAVVGAWREQAPRLVGGLLRLTRDLDLAEDLAHDAMEAALQQWPRTGVPDNPAAWLQAVAHRRAVDHLRRQERYSRAQTRIAAELRTEETMPEPDTVEDDVLRLMLITCHPALTAESQIALTLRLVGGLTAREIARAFMVPEPTIVRRITRAKAALASVARDAGADVPFELPAAGDRTARLPAVLQVVYLIFTEGYAATGGEQWIRADLCDEAIRLGDLVARLFPDPETRGLLALMWLQVSRSPARIDATGEPVLLEDQNRDLWDRPAIHRGLSALHASLAGGPPGFYTLQAIVAAGHAQASTPGETDWVTIAGAYDRLAELSSSPVLLLNRAVAHGMADGPDAGLRLAAELADEPALRDTPLLAGVRGDLLQRLGRTDQARAEFEAAAGLAGTARERTFFERRARRAGDPRSAGPA
jgi:RNA polymerase sigma-70 factor, ECF subfamily